MADSEVEDLLRRYRPVGPPADLRERILGTEAILRIWPWAAAAAVLLVAALTLHFGGRYESARADSMLEPPTIIRVADELTEMLGGDAGARELAEFILAEQVLRKESANVMPPNAETAGAGQLR